MKKQYTEKQLKIFTVGTRVLSFILGVLLLILTIVKPICFLLSIVAFVFAFKYNAENFTNNKKTK